MLGVTVLNIFAGSLAAASGMALMAHAELRVLRRWPAEPEGPVPSGEQFAIDMALRLAGLALIITGLFV
ncbi:MAG: hypothetical protein LC798_15360 [Chloroflexi bacterium]|nr:hypothetical protein [Chloroflexota bacterium]